MARQSSKSGRNSVVRIYRADHVAGCVQLTTSRHVVLFGHRSLSAYPSDYTLISRRRSFREQAAASRFRKSAGRAVATGLNSSRRESTS